MKLYTNITTNEDDKMYRYDHRPKQCIVVNKQNKLVFFHKFQYPYLNGSVYYGRITGIDNILKAVFVRFGEENYQGILSFYSIDLSILGIAGKHFKQKVINESPDRLRYSKIYQNISFNKYLQVGQLILVQVINVYTNKGIKLSNFITLYSGNVKYIPNSLCPKVITNNKHIRQYIAVANLPGSVLIKNRSKNNNAINDLKVLEHLVYKWEQIQATRDIDLVYNPSPIDYILSQFPIDTIYITDHKLKNSIEYSYNCTTSVVKQLQLQQYQPIINNISTNKLKITTGVQCDFFSSSTATQITLSINPENKNIHLLGIIDSIIDQIHLRNLGGLIIIILPVNFQSIEHNIRSWLYQHFHDDKIVSYIYNMQQNIICVISKKYTYNLMQVYLSKTINNCKEKIIYAQEAKLLIIYHNKTLHVDVNRSKSRLENYDINIASIKKTLHYYNTHYATKSTKECYYIIIDLLESSIEQRSKLMNDPTLSNYQLTICPLSVMIIKLIN